ncbi:hypothetical protein QAD02_014044 [Eretmocerus hayati]|uniref:Uncharacterized protein n=1 Tax=Eretmocerus hayati TaxID=131215 RepID=A0ACC2P4H0_9HYME|nr:hypothetical protein QAD02_014044 [Eretmocerus hayati]
MAVPPGTAVAFERERLFSQRSCMNLSCCPARKAIRCTAVHGLNGSVGAGTSTELSPIWLFSEKDSEASPIFLEVADWRKKSWYLMEDIMELCETLPSNELGTLAELSQVWVFNGKSSLSIAKLGQRSQTLYIWSICKAKDPNVAKQWVEVIQNEALHGLSHKDLRDEKFKVCCLHFGDNSVDILKNGRKQLKRTAVPSLRLPTSTPELSEKRRRIGPRKSKEHCIVPGCLSDYKVRNFGIPKDPLIASKWIVAVQNEALTKKYPLHDEWRKEGFKVCHLHFCEGKDYTTLGNGRYQLIRDAVPSGLLPSSTSNQQSDMIDLEVDVTPSGSFLTMTSSTTSDVPYADSETEQESSPSNSDDESRVFVPSTRKKYRRKLENEFPRDTTRMSGLSSETPEQDGAEPLQERQSNEANSLLGQSSSEGCSNLTDLLSSNPVFRVRALETENAQLKKENSTLRLALKTKTKRLQQTQSELYKRGKKLVSYDPKKVPFRSKSIMFPPLSDILKDCSSKVKNCTQCFEILKSVNCVNTLVKKYQECKLILIEALPNVFHMPRIVARLSNELMKKVFFNASIECSENHIHAHQIFSSCLSTKYILSVISYLNRVMDGKVIVNETERLNSVIKMAHDIHLKTLYKKNRAIVKPTNA